MTKYLNPVNYFKFINRKIHQYNVKKLEKKINNIKYLSKNLQNISSVDKLLEFHFNTFSSNDHINKQMFKILLDLGSGSSLKILETGSSAHGTKSSVLFANYVNLFGGQFDTVDLNPGIKTKYKYLESDKVIFHTGDSVEFIKNLDKQYIKNLDIVYLDSFDLDVNNPQPSQNHGFQEFICIYEYMKKGSYIAIDDTPTSFDKFGLLKENKYNFTPGKGRLVLEYLDDNPKLFEIIFHDYAVVLKKI